MRNDYILEFIQKKMLENFESTKYEMEGRPNVLSLHKSTCPGDLEAIIKELRGRKISLPCVVLFIKGGDVH